ncbi:hypothetical protein CRE_21684 [Caenorhabditis remanei]|uniref:Uncharacterized protein n=1 Tax=Caenorhabditis remanei TaxID=31234 RepID=E3NSY2_CAERE|nr:hypothetical protein CRE_21684 [Caenorhabditis remanei]
MRFFNTISFGTCGIFLFALGFFDPEHHKYIVTVCAI